MQMMDMLAQTGGIESIARELGISTTQAQSGANALLPAILGGFKKQAQGSGGAGGLGAILGQLGGGNLLDEVVSPQPTNVSHGNDVLGQIFGSKDVSRTVAQNASTQTGLDPSILKKMLPMLAMLVTGFMARQGGAGAQGGGVLGNVLGGILGGGTAQPRAQPGGGGLASMLDFDGDGNPLDDILSMAKKLGR